MEVNAAILERLERVVESLQDNSIKMGQLLAVHQEKLDQQEKIDEVLFTKIDHLHADLHKKTEEIKKGCERDVLLVDGCLLYTSPSPRDKRQSRMPSSA